MVYFGYYLKVYDIEKVLFMVYFDSMWAVFKSVLHHAYLSNQVHQYLSSKDNSTYRRVLS